MYGKGIPNGTGNPMGMGLKHEIRNGNGREWEPPQWERELPIDVKNVLEKIKKLKKLNKKRYP